MSKENKTTTILKIEYDDYSDFLEDFQKKKQDYKLTSYIYINSEVHAEFTFEPLWNNESVGKAPY